MCLALAFTQLLNQRLHGLDGLAVFRHSVCINIISHIVADNGVCWSWQQWNSIKSMLCWQSGLNIDSVPVYSGHNPHERHWHDMGKSGCKWSTTWITNRILIANKISSIMVQNFTVNQCGPVHITMGDGGNIEGLCKYLAQWDEITVIMSATKAIALHTSFALCGLPSNIECALSQTCVDTSVVENGRHCSHIQVCACCNWQVLVAKGGFHFCRQNICRLARGVSSP